MKQFAITNTDIAYYGYIFKYCKAENEKELLKDWINSDNNFKDCKIIRKPKNVILKYGAKYCFEHNGKYYYCYEVKA